MIDQHLFNLPSRFVSQIVIDEEKGCWVWIGATDTSGYGHAKWKGQTLSVHRIVWLIHNGESPPENMQLDHLCRVRSCCNPEHLEVVTPGENLRRGNSPSAIAARADQCRNGHRLSESRYISPSGKKMGCRLCRNERARQRRLRMKP